jgi:ABC-type amino acid transport substrate-binding protein
MSVALRRAFLLALAFAAVAGAARVAGARELHGESDAFSADGVAIAWAILRAPNPEDATVVMRIAKDDARLPALGVVAIDPFGGQSQVVRVPAAASGALDVPTRRARFADFARTEVRLYAKAAPGPADAPALVVFYQGVPDTTPEFETEAKLREWLDGRMARLRANQGGRKP